MHLLTPRNGLRQSVRASAFTLIEILVAIAVVAILATVTIVGIGNVRQKAIHMQCAANLRSIGQGVSLFLMDHDNFYPGPGADGGSRPYLRLSPYMNIPGQEREGISNGVAWKRQLNGYQLKPFHSPFSNPNHYTPGNPDFINEFIGLYGLNIAIVYYAQRDSTNMRGANANDIHFPSRTVLAGEHYAKAHNGAAIAGHLNNQQLFPSSPEGLASNIGIEKYGITSARGPANVLFCDGHVETIQLEDLSPWPGTENAKSTIIFTPQPQ